MRKAKGKPMVLSWSQIAHVACVLGVLPMRCGKGEAFTLRNKLLDAGHVRPIVKSINNKVPTLREAEHHVRRARQNDWIPNKPYIPAQVPAAEDSR